MGIKYLPPKDLAPHDKEILLDLHRDPIWVAVFCLYLFRRDVRIVDRSSLGVAFRSISENESGFLLTYSKQQQKLTGKRERAIG